MSAYIITVSPVLVIRMTTVTVVGALAGLALLVLLHRRAAR